MRVNSLDLVAVKVGLTPGPVPINNRADVNHDTRVNAQDLGNVKRNLFRQLPLITAPPTPLGPAGRAAAFSATPAIAPQPAATALPPLDGSKRALDLSSSDSILA